MRPVSPRGLLAAVVVAALVVTGMGSIASLTAANSVQPSRVGERIEAVTADDLKPSECAGVVLHAVASGSGSVNGPPGNALVLGSSGDDVITGGTGNDCLVGGNGSDILIGGDGNDICAGNVTTTFDPSCETKLP